MTEPTPEYSVTMDVIIVTDSWEARLLQKAREMRAAWLKGKRRLILWIDDEGGICIIGGEPMGRIKTI